MFGWLKKGKKQENDNVEFEPPAAQDIGGGEDLFAGMEMPTGDDLFGGMTVGNAPATDPAPDAEPQQRKMSGMHSMTKGKFQPGAMSVPVTKASPAPAPIPVVAAPPPPAPVVRAPPPSADPTTNFHNQFDVAMKKLVGDFVSSSKDESDTRLKLSSLETTKMEIRESLLKCEAQQAEALATEDYETAEKMTKQIDTFRSQLEALDTQKERGLSRLADLRKHLGEKIEMFSTVLDKVNNGLSQLVTSKETTLNQKKEAHAREFSTLSNQYTEYQGRADAAENQCNEKKEEANNQLKEIESKIYDETKTDSDTRDSQQKRKDELDVEIADLEARLKELQQERVGCLRTIGDCEKSINTVRKNYVKDINPINLQLKKLDDEAARIQKDQKTASKMKDNMESRKSEFDIEEEVLGIELEQLNSEHSALLSSVDVAKLLHEKYTSFCTNAGPDSLKSLKQELETKRRTIAEELLKHQTIDQEIQKKKEDVQKLEASIPGWEDNKKKAIAGKNFAIAGKMSAQIKKAQTDMEELKKEIEDKETDMLQYDTKMSRLNKEVDHLQIEIEREERSFDYILITDLREIVQIAETGKQDLNSTDHLSDVFQDGFLSFYDSIHSCFNDSLQKLEERCAAAPPPAPAQAAAPPSPPAAEEEEETPEFAHEANEEVLPTEAPATEPAVELTEEEKEEIRQKVTDLENTLAGLQLEEKFDECEAVQKEIDELQLKL